jgi:replicative DNA helicase
MTDTDPVAERQILAIALAAPDAAHATFNALPPNAWSDSHNALVAAVISEQFARDEPVDPAVISRKVIDRAGTDAAAKQLGRLVTDLATTALPAESLSYYAERVAKLAVVRRVAAEAQRLAAAVNSAARIEDDEVFTSAVRRMRTELENAEVSFAPAAVEPPMSLEDLLSQDYAYNWLVPGLLECTDRLILTGFEGTGKSYLLAQFALTIAAGLHPFTGDPFGDPQQVLVVDCENSQRQLARRYQKIREVVNYLREVKALSPIDWRRQVRFVIRPEGVALTEPRELARIEQAIAATGPRLVVAGPLYRMSKLDTRDEQAAKELTDTLDMLRVRHQFALIAEAHVGHGAAGQQRHLRPTGSSLFLRWPEFGYGIRAFADAVAEEHPSTVEVVAWRGSRDERHWPKLLKHSDLLPWTPANHDYYDRPLRSIA